MGILITPKREGEVTTTSLFCYDFDFSFDEIISKDKRNTESDDTQNVVDLLSKNLP